MYFVSLSIKSDCGLSRAAQSADNKIITLNIINNLNLNNLIAFTISKNTDLLKTGIVNDFKKYSFLKGKNLVFLIGTKESHGIVPAILENSSIPIYPFYAENGAEMFQIISPDRESMELLIKSIERNNTIENIDYEKITDGDSMYSIFKRINRITYVSELTEIEMKIIKRAFNEGFYSWPRALDLTSISKSFNLAKPTVLYHLRNAERKIVGSLLSK